MTTRNSLINAGTFIGQEKAFLIVIVDAYLPIWKRLRTIPTIKTIDYIRVVILKVNAQISKQSKRTKNIIIHSKEERKFWVHAVI